MPTICNADGEVTCESRMRSCLVPGVVTGELAVNFIRILQVNENDYRANVQKSVAAAQSL